MSSSGKETGDGPPPDLTALQENFGQQQAKITALKELVRQSEVAQGQKNATAQEKVRNIAQRLSHLKSKTFRLKKGDKSINEIKEEPTPTEHSDHECRDTTLPETPSSSRTTATPKSRSETPGAEKIQLLRRQMEENRQKMAEREHSKRDIEVLVTQLKAKFDNSQFAIQKSSQLGRSVDDLSSPKHPAMFGKYQSASDLSDTMTLVDKERIKYLEKRLSEMETEIKDKEQQFLHKDPQSEHLKIIKHLEGKILDFEENIKEKESVIEARTQAVSLLSENMSLKGKNTVDLLEETRQEMVEMQRRFIESEEEYKSEIEALKLDVEDREARIAELNEVNDILENARFDLTCKTSALNTRIGDLEEECKKLTELNVNYVKQFGKIEEDTIDRLDSDQLDDDLRLKVRSLEILLEENMKKITGQSEMIEKLEVELVDRKNSVIQIDLSDDQSLEASLQENLKLITNQKETIDQLESDLAEKTVEYNVLNANFTVLQEKLKSMTPKSLFTEPAVNEESENEIAKLKDQLDQANKNAIKSKLKINQLQKQLKKLNKNQGKEEGESLGVDPVAKDEEAKRVSGHIENIELEEKIEILTKTIAELQTEVYELNAKKTDLNSQLNHYIVENMELLDKLEKLSKGSSAESIEIVEGLTHQEKIEMAQSLGIVENLTEKMEMKEIYTPIVGHDESHGVVVDDLDNSAMSQDLSESLVKLREDSSMLMHKIEMFTNERKEVMEKMEDLKLENSNFSQKIDDLIQSKADLHKEHEALKEQNVRLENALKEEESEKRNVLENLKELSKNRNELREEINVLTKQKLEATQPVITVEIPEPPSMSTDSEPYANILRDLDTELENYRRGKDKNAKFNISKKVAKEARNAHTLMRVLLEDYQKSLSHSQLLELQLNSIKQMQHQMTSSVDETAVPLPSSPQSDDFVLPDEKELNECREEVQRMIELDEERNKDKTEFSPSTKRRPSRDMEIESKVETIEVSTDPHYDLDEQHRNQLKEIRIEFESRLDVCHKEIDILKALVAEQKEQLISTFEEHEIEIEERNKIIAQLENKVKSMTEELEQVKNQMNFSQESYIKDLQQKLEALKIIFDENNDLIEQQTIEIKHKQETIDTLNAQIIEMYKSMEDTSNQLIEKDDEIQRLGEIADRGGVEIEKLQKLGDMKDAAIDELNEELEEKMQEIERIDRSRKESLNSEKRIKELENVLRNTEQSHADAIRQLNETIAQHRSEIEELKNRSANDTEKIDFENTIKKLEDKNKEQLEKLKKFAANLKKKTLQVKELEDQHNQLKMNFDQKSIESSSAVKHEEEHLQQKSVEFESQLKDLINQNSGLSQQIYNLQMENSSLHQCAMESEKKFNDLSLKWDEDHWKFQNDHEKMSNKLLENVEQIDRLNREIEKRDSEISILNGSIQSLKSDRSQFDGMTEDLNSKTTKLEKCKAIIKAKNQQIKTLTEQQQQKQDAGQSNEDHRLYKEQAEAKLNSLNEEIANLKESYDHLRSASEIKIDENAHYIETLQLENDQLKEKISKLEEGIGFVEDRRSSLERQAENLGVQLQDKDNEFKQNEDELLQRLNALSRHDELVEQKLREAVEEKDDLSASLQDLQQDRDQLMQKVTALQSQLDELKNSQLVDLEMDNNSLQKKNEFLQTELKRQNSEFERKLAEKGTEVCELEDNLVIQMNALENDRRSIQESLEIVRDENDELRESFNRFKEIAQIDRTDLERELNQVKIELDEFNQTAAELQELRVQIVHDQNEIDNLKAQNLALIQSNEAEINALKQQIAELESMRNQIGQNQTDDQIFIQNENERLQTLLAAKEIEIQNYQRQNLQLQMSVSAFSGPSDPFASISTDVPQKTDDRDAIDNLKTKLQDATDNEQRLNEANSALQSELISIQHQYQQFHAAYQTLQNEMLPLSNQNLELQSQLAHKTAIFEEIEAKFHQIHAKNETLQHEIGTKQLETTDLNVRLETLQQEYQQNQDAMQKAHENLKTVQTELESCKNQLGKATNEIANRKEEDLNSQEELNNRQQLINQLSADLKRLHEEHSLTKSQLADAQELLHNQAAYSGDVEAQVQQFSGENVRLQNSNAELQFQFDNLMQAFNESNSLHSAQTAELQNSIVRKDQEIEHLKNERATKEVIEEPIHVQTVQQVAGSPAAAEPAAKISEYEHQIVAMEQYISQLQIQLRISTADCEQQAETIQSLENEIQSKTAEVKQLQSEKSVVQETVTLPPIVPQNVQLEKPSEPSTGIPSFNSSIFFGGTSTGTPFDEALSVVPEHSEPDKPKSECPPDTDTADAEEFYGRVPVVEETIVPKKAYLCYDKDEENIGGGGETTADDGWGFGSDDAALEEQHQQTFAPSMTASLVPAYMEYEVRLQEYEDKIHELSMERDKLREETVTLKATSAKFMKKLKEFKSKNDELTSAQRRKSSSVESNELDLAIQDELNVQVKTMEAKLKELRSEQEKENAEKQNLTKRVDVLIAANDRLTEMKEQQDHQLAIASKRIEDLNYKLNQLSEWDDKPENVLANEEVTKMQCLLNEERSHALILEDRIRKLQNSLVAKNDFEQELTEAEGKLYEMTIENEKLQGQAQLVQRLEAEIKCLKDESHHMEDDYKKVKTNLNQLQLDYNQKVQELEQLKQKNSELLMEMDRLNSSHLLGDSRQELEGRIQELMATIQYKDAEMIHLNQKASELDSIFVKLKEKDQEIDRLEIEIMELQNSKLTLEKKLTEKNADNLDASDIQELRKSNAALQHTIFELQEEKQQMEHELQVLNDQVLKSLSMEDQMKMTILEIDMKNSEIAELRHSVDLLKQQQGQPNLNQSELSTLNAQWEQVLEQRCAELAESWRQHLATKDEEFSLVETALRQEINNLQAKLPLKPETSSMDNSSPDTDLRDDTEFVKSLQTALGKQDEEIASLKQQLALRSAEYARVLTQMDPYGQRTSPTSMMSMASLGPANETVQKSENDLALYMLYQRDMRCEELTEELVHLLEERDMLQLKLSNSIRQIEEMNTLLGSDASSQSGTIEPSSQIPENLVDKMSQLQRTGQTRTTKLLEEREHSQRQMALLQKDVATLPPEAVAELIGEYPPSRPSSNPSSLLLNWLWGNKSPGGN